MGLNNEKFTNTGIKPVSSGLSCKQSTSWAIKLNVGISRLGEGVGGYQSQAAQPVTAV